MIYDYVDEAKRLAEEYKRATDELNGRLSKVLGVDVLSIDEKGRIHIDDEEYVSKLPGSAVTARMSDFFPWEVHAEVDGCYLFAIMTGSKKRELANG